MADIVTVARPYAEAAFKIAEESGNFAEWSDALELTEAVVRDPDMAARIGNPNVDARSLESAILGTVGTRIDGNGRNLIQVLVQNGRLELISHIRELYEARRREHEGMLEAKIVSAMPLSDEQVRQLVTKLEQKYHRKVTAEVEVDPQLIGGARIIVGDKVIDATVRGRLDAMAAALTH